jgi:hypothetical protein
MNPVPPYPGTPRWVKVSLAVAAVFVMVFALFLNARLMGEHGPALHETHSPSGARDLVPPGDR